MKAKTNDPSGAKVLGFELEKTRYRLGNSDRYIEIDDGDANLPARIVEAQENIRAYVQRLRDEGLAPAEDGKTATTGDLEKDLALLSEADTYIREQIDYAFDAPVSAVAFGRASCLSVTKGGEYYFENFMNAFLPMIEAEFGTRINRLSLRAQAYTGRKGQHGAPGASK